MYLKVAIYKILDSLNYKTTAACMPAGHSLYCAKSDHICAVQEAAQPSTSELAQQESGNSLQQVFARCLLQPIDMFANDSCMLYVCPGHIQHPTGVCPGASHPLSCAKHKEHKLDTTCICFLCACYIYHAFSSTQPHVCITCIMPSTAHSLTGVSLVSCPQQTHSHVCIMPIMPSAVHNQACHI